MRITASGFLLALALAAAPPAAAQAPALGDAPATPKHDPAGHGRSSSPTAGLAVADVAAAAKNYDDLSAYGPELETLQDLARRVKPDADLELWRALCEARLGRAGDAWKRLNGPLLAAAAGDSGTADRRHDYDSGRATQWLDGRFDGWNWYILRAKAELAAAQGLWHEARVAAEGCVAARPLAGKEWLVLAVCSAHDGDEARATAATREAARLDPTLPEAQYLLGLEEWRAGRRAEAQARFRAAVSLDSLYSPAATALVRAQLPFGKPDGPPIALLTGVRGAGLVTSPAGPKLEEFVQMDQPAVILQQAVATMPDSLRQRLANGQMTLPVLVNATGRIVMHELPWFDATRLPSEAVTAIVQTLPSWRFRPATRNGQPRAMWTAIQLSLQAGP